MYTFNMTEEARVKYRTEKRMRKKEYKRKVGKALTYNGDTTLYTDVKNDNIGTKKEYISDTQNKTNESM